MDIILKDVVFTYMKRTPFENKAINKINLLIQSNSITGIIGNTGSGKTTILQLIAGLIKQDSGDITIGKLDWKNKKDTLELRRQVGLVFQNSEQQVFEETVEKDISFGPRNFGYTEEQTMKLTKEALERMQLSYQLYAGRSPFELSGGERKKVAIAGVLAYQPKVLLLDEPFVGLDPIGKKEIMEMIIELQRKQGLTIIIVSHNMDEVAQIADNIVLLKSGQVCYNGIPKELFTKLELLGQNNLDIPEITKLIIKINEKTNPPIPLDCFSIDSLEEHLVKRIKGSG
ncbi:MAG: ATP-binding cassette domain-containing protein [Vulcanibacillus sp.]